MFAGLRGSCAERESRTCAVDTFLAGSSVSTRCTTTRSSFGITTIKCPPQPRAEEASVRRVHIRKVIAVHSHPPPDNPYPLHSRTRHLPRPRNRQWYFPRTQLRAMTCSWPHRPSCKKSKPKPSHIARAHARGKRGDRDSGPSTYSVSFEVRSPPSSTAGRSAGQTQRRSTAPYTARKSFPVH